MDSISKQLAGWCASVEARDVSSGVQQTIPLRVMDSVGLMIAGWKTPAVRTAKDMARHFGGLAQCTIIGGGERVPSASAALVHGIAAHCHDFDDTFPDSVVHPGSIVIPTALAIAEANSAPDEEFCLSIAVGYEVAARLGAVAGRKFHARNMHASGIVGPIVAAAVAGRLLRLDAQQISWAIGLAASMSSGIRAYAIDGGWSKWLHLGWAAHGGIVAAELASRGFRGPEHVLDGGHDLYTAMLHGDEVDRSSLLADLGNDWRGLGAEFKYYPCAHVIQPFVDAVLAIVREQDLRATDIEKIECTIAPWAAAIVCEPREAKLRFDTELEATGSLPYQISMAVLERRLALDALEERSRQRRDVADFCQRVTHRTDDGLGGRFDGLVDVLTKSGKSFARRATLADLDSAKIIAKFGDLAEPVIGKEPARVAVSALSKPQSDWRAAVTLLGGCGNSSWAQCSSVTEL